MKNLRIQIKNSEIQTKNPKVWILTCQPYLQGNRQKSIQEFAKNPKLKNGRETKNLQNLEGQWFSQKSKNPKFFNENFQILERSNSLPAYLRWLFLRIVTAPPPYTMESVNTLQVVMGVTDFVISSNS
ncbi:MAG: hypothetical protein KGP29_05825 [Proteobacteria bacterium]|nr:hypothetical protein [Pseudomonadota bacterium]